MVANILLRYNKVQFVSQYFRSGYLEFSWERMGAGVPPGLQNRVWRLWALGGFDSYPFPPAFVIFTSDIVFFTTFSRAVFDRFRFNFRFFTSSSSENGF